MSGLAINRRRVFSAPAACAEGRGVTDTLREVLAWRRSG
jgi:hypothetical protein